MPELAEASKHIMVEETKEGLNIELVDQEGRSMFAEGSKEPYERTRRIIEKLAGPLKATPYRGRDHWRTRRVKDAAAVRLRAMELVGGSCANAVRQILRRKASPQTASTKVARQG